MIDELVKMDNTFNESKFISKANNIFAQICDSIMMDTLPEIDHFVSDEVYKELEEIVNTNKNNNLRKMYDELNIVSKIESINEDVDNYIINVLVTAKYMDYYISYDNGDYLKGNNKSRTDHYYNLIFEKKKNSKELEAVRRCPSCGNPLDINNSGKCNYCGAIFNQEEYDWVVTKIEEK